MTSDMVDRLLQSIANAGRMSTLDDLDPCLVDEPAMLAPESCGCAFGGGKSDDTDTLRDAVKVCQDVTAQYHERMKAMGLE